MHVDNSSDNQTFTVARVEKFESRKLGLLPGEVILAKFSGFDNLGQSLIEINGLNPTDKPQVAKATTNLQQSDVGRMVVVMFISGDINQPIITGLVRSPLYDMLENPEPTLQDFHSTQPDFENEAAPLFTEQQLIVDGKRVLIEGSEEVVLQCGEASITLTKAGEILVRGKYLSSRSSGVNKIMGGSVQVN